MKPDFCVTILGKSSALPTSTSFPSSQLVRYHNASFLVDCGEGCQIQIRRNKIGLANIKHIFISHLHGDHYFGLFGLFSSMQLLGRKKILHIYAHAKLESLIKFVFYHNGSTFSFPVIFHPLSFSEKMLIFSSKKLDVFSFPLKHRIPTCGFLFQEKQGDKNIKKSAIEDYNLSYTEIRRIKSGAALIRDNNTIADNDALTLPDAESRSYAYCSDTGYYPEMVKDIRGVQYLYHEATYADDMESSGEARFHATGRQAGKIARAAGAKKLLLGHFSTRYKSHSIIETQAREEFAESYAVNENDLYCL
ncbi:MAG: ribonuclease Z [Bacteroidales bacterium]